MLSSAASASAQGDEATERCGRAVVNGGTKVLKADAHALRSCAVAVLEPAAAGEIDEACRKLRTPGLRLERIDSRVRTRVSRRCAAGMPSWLPDECRGPGPASGARLNDASALADCTARTGHCTALLSLDGTFEDAVGPLLAQHPQNLAYEFNGIASNSFLSCLDQGSAPSSTTTTTLPAPSTTTTLTTPPTTSTTTSLPAPTTTTTTTLGDPGPARLVITEFMSNPAAQSDATGEYFELYNAGDGAVDLAGLVVRDQGSDGFTVTDALVVDPGAYVVFGKSETAADGRVDYVYGSGMNLTNSSDAIIIERDGAVLDAVAYDAAFPLTAGRSTELTATVPDAATNDLAASWCASDTPLGDGDAGTPRAAAGACLQ